MLEIWNLAGTFFDLCKPVCIWSRDFEASLCIWQLYFHEQLKNDKCNDLWTFYLPYATVWILLVEVFNLWLSCSYQTGAGKENHVKIEECISCFPDGRETWWNVSNEHSYPRVSRAFIMSWLPWYSNHLIWQSEGNFSCCESGMENTRAFSGEKSRLVSGRTGNPSAHCPEQIRSIREYIQKYLYSHSSVYCKSIIHKYIVPFQKGNSTSLLSSAKPVPSMKKNFNMVWFICFVGSFFLI